MRTDIRAALCCVLLSTSSAAIAATGSFANRSLGVGLGGFKLLGETPLIDWGAPLTLEGGLYLENGWDFYLRVPLMLLKQNANPDQPLIFAFGGQLGVRYLFLEESVRPYLGAHLAGLYLVRDALPNYFVGPGANAGLEFFVVESISIGARAYVDLYLNLNQPPGFSVGGALYATTYF